LLLFKPAGSLVMQWHASVPGALLEQQQAAVAAACHWSAAEAAAGGKHSNGTHATG